VRIQVGTARRARTCTREAARRDPPKPVRAIELSSSDLEIVETAPVSRLRFAQPPPLPNQSIDEGARIDSAQSSAQMRPTSVMTRRFGLRARLGVIAMLCIAANAAALTIARTSDHPFKIQNRIISNSTQVTPMAPASREARPVFAKKSPAQVRSSSAPKALPQKVRAQSAHAAVANVKDQSKGKLPTTSSTHGKSPTSTGAKVHLMSSVSFPVDL